MDNLLKAILWALPASALLIFLFRKMNKYINEEHREKMKDLKKQEALLLLQQSNLRDKYSSILRKKTKK